ncbi:MAG: leucine-rich repeat domain-containing protein, partial [Prevotella sp.]|nr:leucine-rich repeat domain-containing protein [Prevotella sp.]
MKKTSLLKAMFISLLLSSLPSSSFAYDFSADNDDGVTIYYNITSSTDRTVEVTGLGNYEYSGDVVIPSTVKYDNTTYLVTSIGESAFSVSSLTSVEIPSSVTSIGSDAFYYCESLTSIEIPSSVTSIGGGAFFYCSSLTSIEIPSSVTSIGSSAFFYCSSLTSIEIPSGVTSIGSYAF